LTYFLQYISFETLSYTPHIRKEICSDRYRL